MEIFKLPIEYCKHFRISESMVEDLEILESRSDKGSMYDILYRPTTEMARHTMRGAARLFTDDQLYLLQTAELVKKVKWVVRPEAAGYAAAWQKHQSNAEFNSIFHYVEYPRLQFLNNYPSALLVLSVQSMLSPVMFLCSPLIILIIPFALLQLTNKNVGWDTYREALKEVLKRHSLGSIFFGPKNISDLISSGAAVGLFLAQLYANLQSCWEFHRNLSKIHEFLDGTKNHLNYVIQMMGDCVAHTRSKYDAFAQDVTLQQEVLKEMTDAVELVKPFRYNFAEMKQLGYLRYLFYRLKNDARWVAAMHYSLGFTGYVENMASVRALLAARRLSACRFAAQGFKFKNIYYPPNPTNVKHTFSLETLSGQIVTGPNASGKTTFIKTAMLGVLFSQQIGCGFYRKATLQPFNELCCYLNIPDTSGRDSLFQAEARRCREILQTAHEGNRMFCIFDELFSGTNPHEASASAYAFLKHIAEISSVKFLLTTHFLDFCKRMLSDKRVRNIYMETAILPNGDLVYQYKLLKGISTIKGALKVLKDLNFPPSIIECAKNY